MNYKTFFLCLKFLTMVVICQGQVNQPDAKKNVLYNILFISIDDLRTELNCYGASHIKSPNIDRLAAQGVRFENAHVQQAICMASRASIMTGIRPEKHGIYTGLAVDDVLPETLTINKYFEQNGYNIASCGKIYHHKIDTKKQFGENEIKSKGTWTGRGYVTPEAIEKITLNTKYNRGPAYEFAPVNDTIYKDGLNTQNALKKMEELSKDNVPFFLSVGLSKPHLPFVAPKKYWDMYPSSTIKITEIRKRPKNGYDKAIRTGGELKNYYGMPELFNEIDDNLALTLRRAYYACISYADAQVGKLLDKLEALRIRDKTIVILWSDHGYKLGDYNSWCKWTNMHLDTNIPLIFSIPEGKRNSVSKTPVAALDIYPTLVELNGLQKPNHLDGKSIVTLLKNPEIQRERVVFSIWPINRNDYKKTIIGYAAKTARFNYVEWIKIGSGEMVGRELFDHRKDPNETLNLIDNIEYAETINFLAKKVSERIQNTHHDHKFKKIDSKY
jgi:iduronate 2-sulfatase